MKICVVTGSRAEYGLLRFLMRAIKDDTNLELQIVVTGMHLSPEFGLTYTEIEKDGFKINYKVHMLLSSDTPESISKSTGLGIIGFSDAFKYLEPSIIILLGDRFEILSASIAALFSKIKVAHIHGGETTLGAYDESIRHSISKMSWWHFVAAREYRNRVIQLGENPKRVFNVGGMGVDSIKKTKLLSKEQLMQKTGIKFKAKNLLVTFHPTTLEEESSEKMFQFLLNVLEEQKDVYTIFTMPNADNNGRIIKKMIDKFVFNSDGNAIAFNSLGHEKYLSTLQFIDGVVGNSSSGLLEAPTFKIGTVNIGDRQTGRLKAKSIIDCVSSTRSIKTAIDILFSKKFKKNLTSVTNPYGVGNATEKILEVIKNYTLPIESKKEFYDI